MHYFCGSKSVYLKVICYLDVDECKTGVCENGYCTNTIGSFVCECYAGYRFNAFINKCEGKFLFIDA